MYACITWWISSLLGLLFWDCVVRVHMLPEGIFLRGYPWLAWVLPHRIYTSGYFPFPPQAFAAATCNFKQNWNNITASIFSFDLNWETGDMFLSPSRCCGHSSKQPDVSWTTLNSANVSLFPLSVFYGFITRSSPKLQWWLHPPEASTVREKCITYSPGLFWWEQEHQQGLYRYHS